MNKPVSTKRVCLSIGISIGVTPIAFFGSLLCGSIVGILSDFTEQHEYNYVACACDEAPLLTVTQAVAVGIAIFLTLATGIYFITRKIKFSMWEQVLALIIYTLANYGAISTAVEMLIPKQVDNGTKIREFSFYRVFIKNVPLYK